MVKTKEITEKIEKKASAKSLKNKADTKESKTELNAKLFSGQYFYGTGKRKTSIAKVRLYDKGSGKIIINGEDVLKFFTPILKGLMLSPLKMFGYESRFNISIKTIGGGVSGQADACRHGIAKAILVFDAESRLTLKKEGHITRDSRIKERKKPGLKRARKAPTWVKR